MNTDNGVASLQLLSVSKRFRTPNGQVYTALQNLNLTVRSGEFLAIVGPTGCGKSTTLTLMSGLERPSAGEVRVRGEPLQKLNPHVGYVFQTDAIFPWKNVLENVAAGPLYHSVRKDEAHTRARDWIQRVGLAGFEEYYPHQLSGGMRKRVALAQTLILKPEILLMDEPFSALDVQTRTLMEDELLAMWSTLSATTVFVTHDLEEAIALADRVCVLTAGPAATVKGTYHIDLPRPRHVDEVRFDPRFVELYREIWQDLRSEVMISYARTKRRAA